MIALDTNVLVRFLAKDDEHQHLRAVTRLRGGVDAGENFFVGDVVLAEVVWVLQSRYRLGRPAIGDTVRALLEAEHLVFESADRCLRALRRYAAGKGGFADYLIAEQARDSGCTVVVTFDHDLLVEADFSAP